MSFYRIITTLMATTIFTFSAFADGLLNANSANSVELSSLNATAAAIIVASRPFATIGDLNAALGDSMNEDDLEELYRSVFVPIDLNTASRENILLIPGVGRRMAHEFEEYRPYTSMEQFRREMAKYVDDEEVARLEMYVTLD